MYERFEDDMRKLILILVLAAGAAYGQGADKPLLAYCELEKGCTFCRSEFSYRDIDTAFNYLGTYERDKGILTFFTNKSGEDTHYPDIKRTAQQLHEYFGGTGTASVLNACPLPNGIIQPNDGNWTIVVAKPQTSNCPKGTDAQLVKTQMIKSGAKVFSKPFKPQDLLDTPEAKWFATNLNRYRAVFSGAVGTFDTVYDVKVLSADSMKGNLSFEIKIPGQKVCRVSQDFTYSRS